MRSRRAPAARRDRSADPVEADTASSLIQDLRRAFGGTFIVNSGFSRMSTRDEAVSAVEEGIADLVAVGRSTIANPDLVVTHWQKGADENEVGQACIYGGGETAYSDYPFLWDWSPDASASRDQFARGPFLCNGPVALHDRARAEHLLLDGLEVGLIPDAIEQPWLEREGSPAISIVSLPLTMPGYVSRTAKGALL